MSGSSFFNRLRRPPGQKIFPGAWPRRSSPPPSVKRRRTGDDADCFCHRQECSYDFCLWQEIFWNAEWAVRRRPLIRPAATEVVDAKGSSAWRGRARSRLRSGGPNRGGSKPSLPAALPSTGFYQNSVGRRGRSGFDWRSRTPLKCRQAFCLNARGGSWR